MRGGPGDSDLPRRDSHTEPQQIRRRGAEKGWRQHCQWQGAGRPVLIKEPGPARGAVYMWYYYSVVVRSDSCAGATRLNGPGPGASVPDSDPESTVTVLYRNAVHAVTRAR